MVRKNNVRERIMDTASRLFYEQGFNNTGINQIIAEAGIAIGSLYKHYQSKDDLLYCYLQEQEHKYFDNLDEFLKDEKKPATRLLKFIDYRIKLQDEANSLGCHFIKINAEIGHKNKRVEQLIASHKQKQRDYIFGIVSEITEVQSLRMDKQAFVNTIFLMIEGALVSTSIQGKTDDLKVVKGIVNNLL